MLVDPRRDLLDVFATFDQPGGDVRHGMMARSLQLGADLQRRFDALRR